MNYVHRVLPPPAPSFQSYCHRATNLSHPPPKRKPKKEKKKEYLRWLEVNESTEWKIQTSNKVPVFLFRRWLPSVAKLIERVPPLGLVTGLQVWMWFIQKTSIPGFDHVFRILMARKWNCETWYGWISMSVVAIDKAWHARCLVKPILHVETFSFSPHLQHRLCWRLSLRTSSYQSSHSPNLSLFTLPLFKPSSIVTSPPCGNTSLYTLYPLRTCPHLKTNSLQQKKELASFVLRCELTYCSMSLRINRQGPVQDR